MHTPIGLQRRKQDIKEQVKMLVTVLTKGKCFVLVVAGDFYWVIGLMITIW